MSAPVKGDQFLDEAAVSEAYKDQVSRLFAVLCTGIAHHEASRRDDAKRNFLSGLRAAMAARDHATAAMQYPGRDEDA